MGKTDVEEATRVEGCVRTNIKYKYNLTPKTLPVDYSEIWRIKNECLPLRNRHSGKIWRHQLQEQYHTVCVINTSKPPIYRRYITILVFKYSMEYIHKHNYELNSIHNVWKSYMVIILSTIDLGKMETPFTITSRHSLLYKPPWSNLHLKQIYQIGRYSLLLCIWNLYLHSFGCLASVFTWMKWTCVSKVTTRAK